MSIVYKPDDIVEVDMSIGQFGHQILDTDEVRGYEGLNICIYFTPNLLRAYATVSWERQASSFDPIMEKLKEHWADGITEDLSLFT